MYLYQFQSEWYQTKIARKDDLKKTTLELLIFQEIKEKVEQIGKEGKKDMNLRYLPPPAPVNPKNKKQENFYLKF